MVVVPRLALGGDALAIGHAPPQSSEAAALASLADDALDDDADQAEVRLADEAQAWRAVLGSPRPANGGSEGGPAHVLLEEGFEAERSLSMTARERERLHDERAQRTFGNQVRNLDTGDVMAPSDLEALHAELTVIRPVESVAAGVPPAVSAVPCAAMQARRRSSQPSSSQRRSSIASLSNLLTGIKLGATGLSQDARDSPVRLGGSASLVAMGHRMLENAVDAQVARREAAEAAELRPSFAIAYQLSQEAVRQEVQGSVYMAISLYRQAARVLHLASELQPARAMAAEEPPHAFYERLYRERAVFLERESEPSSSELMGRTIADISPDQELAEAAAASAYDATAASTTSEPVPVPHGHHCEEIKATLWRDHQDGERSEVSTDESDAEEAVCA